MKTEMMDELDADLQEKLWLLKDVPPRDPKIKARSRAQYLTQLKNMPSRKYSAGIFSIWPFSTLMKKQASGYGFETARLRSAFATIALVIVVLFTGISATAYAAQDSLPGSILYPVKLLTEDFRLDLTRNAETKFSLSLAYANKRVDEIAALQSQGVPVEEPLLTRLEDQYEFALQLASGMPDDQMTQSLEQLRETTQFQLNTMTTLRENAPQVSEGQLERVQEMLAQQQNMAQDGLEDPVTFRETIKNKSKEQEPNQNPGNQNQQRNDDGSGKPGLQNNDSLQISPETKGPNHDQQSPIPPGGSLENGNALSPAGVERSGNGRSFEDNESEESSGNVDEEDFEVWQDFNKKVHSVQYGVSRRPVSQQGQQTVFDGSSIFVP